MEAAAAWYLARTDFPLLEFQNEDAEFIEGKGETKTNVPRPLEEMTLEGQSPN